MIDFNLLTGQAAGEGIERIGVGVAVRDHSGRYLLIRRAAHDVLPGLWEYPGGGREEGEEVPDGAARELAEETGLAGLTLDYARALDYVNQKGLRVRQFVFAATVPDGTVVTLSDDHDDHQWADPGQLPQTSDGQREVIQWLTGRLVNQDWRPVGGYVETVARPTMYGCVLLSDRAGRVIGMRSTIDPTVWNLPGGTVENGETPFLAALRETSEELGLDLAQENPDLIARQRLVAIIHEQADAAFPVPVVSFVFDGGVLTEEQQARIHLDPAEHTEWRFETIHDWHGLMPPERYRRLLQIHRAYRHGAPLYLESPASAGDDFEGVMVFVTTPSGKVLMHLRDDKQGIAWPGYWTPIGGWREGDETPRQGGAREVLEEAGIQVTGLRELPGPRHESVSPLTRVLHAVWDGPESEIRLGDEGVAVRMVPFSEVLGLRTPPYMHHYLPLLADAASELPRSQP